MKHMQTIHYLYLVNYNYITYTDILYTKFVENQVSDK